MTIRTFKSGHSREQTSFLPPRVEDYVGADNPVRAIDAYVGSVDLGGFGFRDAGSGAGQAPYDPADLLKLYLYGYLNRVRSSRRLECEARRNLELIWLLRGLAPGYRTIANFRKDNAAALTAANRAFVLLARGLELVGGELIAIDGAFFHGDASKASILTRRRLREQLAAIDGDLEEYSRALDANDAAEAAEAAPEPAVSAAAMAGKIALLRQKRAGTEAVLKRLADSGETQISRTDPDARLLAKTGQVVSGYNVQIAVDEKHKLIVASEVVNDGNDTGQLYALADAAKAALGVAALNAVADAGYYNAETLKSCEDAAITAYVPEPDRGRRLEAAGRFAAADFRYDAEADLYRCPGGAELRPMRRQRRYPDGKMAVRYASRRPVCRGCPLRARCLSPGCDRREIERWVHADVIARHRARMQDAENMMKRRKALAEHPFGTLKCRAGYRHFLVRGFNKVRGEWNLMALCYNLGRVLNILGLERLLLLLRLRSHTKSRSQPAAV